MKKRFLIVLFVSILMNVVSGIYFGNKFFKNKNLGRPVFSEKTGNEGSLDTLNYFDSFLFEKHGQAHTEKNFQRLPSTYEHQVRKEVWDLSRHSSGLSIKFKTNSSILSVKWEVESDATNSNMTKIAVSGLDLYCMKDGMWQYVNSAAPTGLKNSKLLISNMDTTSKQFTINLPLYAAIKKLEIGVDKSASINSTHTSTILPIVFYGTSITQGCSASRPGMAYPSIISRKLDIETINLGFSSNGRFEKSIGNFLCEAEARLYIIDCTPNSPPDTIKKNALNLVLQLQKCRPNTPVLLIESIVREYAYFNNTMNGVFVGKKFIDAQNDELRKVFAEALKRGVKNLYYLKGEDLIGSDHEGTVDGTHLSDLGQMRMADKVSDEITKILNLKRTPK